VVPRPGYAITGTPICSLRYLHVMHAPITPGSGDQCSEQTVTDKTIAAQRRRLRA